MYQDGTYDVDYEMNNARALSDMLARIDNARKSDPEQATPIALALLATAHYRERRNQ